MKFRTHQVCLLFPVLDFFTLVDYSMEEGPSEMGSQSLRLHLDGWGERSRLFFCTDLQFVLIFSPRVGTLKLMFEWENPKCHVYSTGLFWCYLTRFHQGPTSRIRGSKHLLRLLLGKTLLRESSTQSFVRMLKGSYYPLSVCFYLCVLLYHDNRF